jgi:hypothetical protein
MQSPQPITPPPTLRIRLQQYWLLLIRFTRRYGPAIAILAASALIGWAAANGVSDYTKGGWEIHFIERGIGLNLHFHHWYYGIPLGVIALLLISWNTNVSIFLFGLGQTLAAHSFINEGGIPSIIEGGATWHVPTEIYFPLVTAFALLYAFFLIRREEWLYRAKEREEIAISYFYPATQTPHVLERLNNWAKRNFESGKQHQDRDTNIIYGQWVALDRPNAEWQLHYTAAPFDSELNLLIVRLEHIPLQGRAGKLDDWLAELDNELKPLVQSVIAGPAESARTAELM